MILHETCLEYFRRRLSEGWECISLEGYNAVLLSPEGIRREIDLRNDALTLRPSGAGDETALTIGGSSPAATNWQSVDEAVADEGVTLVRSTHWDYLRDLYSLPASGIPAGSTINFIKIYFRCKHVDAVCYAKPSQKSGAIVKDGNEVTLDGVWTPYSQQYNDNPATSTAYTVAEINALQIGVALKQDDTAGECTQVYVEIDYSAAAPPAKKPTFRLDPKPRVRARFYPSLKLG